MRNIHLAGMVIILALVACTGAVSAVSLKAGSMNLAAVNTPVEIPVTLSAADGGISGYIITITTREPAIAEITEAKLPGWVNPDYGSVETVAGVSTLKVADIADFIQAPGTAADGYPLALVEVNGKTRDASTDLLVTVLQMDADDGTFVDPTVVNGVIGVELLPGSIVVNTIGTTGLPLSGATIFLDGTPKDQPSPATLTDIIPGKHRVKVSLTNYAEQEKEVTVERGTPATVTFTLVRTGSFRVFSRPEADADILVNGNPVGKKTIAAGTVISGYDPAQNYIIRVEKAGFWGAQGTYQTTPTGTKPVVLTMSPAGNEIPGTINVDTVQGSAQVYLNDEEYGTTPASITVNPGTYQVYVMLEGYARSETREVTIIGGDTRNLVFTLEEGGSIPVPEFPMVLAPLVSLLGLALVIVLLKARKGG